MFSKLRRSKSEAAAHASNKPLTGMPALKFLRKSKKKTSYTDLSNPIVPLPEHERLGLPSNEPEMKYIGPKSHLEESNRQATINSNGNISSRMNGGPTNLNNLRDRHNAVVGKYGDINNIDRFKSMPFEQKESLMYYNEIVSGKTDNDTLDNSYLNTNKPKPKPKRDPNKGHGLHSVKKRRREGRKDLIALTPRERESISFLDGVLQQLDQEMNSDDDTLSQTSSLGSVIDMVGDFESPSPTRKDKSFTLPQMNGARDKEPEKKAPQTTENIDTKKHKSPPKEKREHKSTPHESKANHQKAASPELKASDINKDKPGKKSKSKHKHKREKRGEPSVREHGRTNLKLIENLAHKETHSDNNNSRDDMIKTMNDLNISNDQVQNKLHNLKHVDSDAHENKTIAVVPCPRADRQKQDGIEDMKSNEKSERKHKTKRKDRSEETEEERRERRARRAQKAGNKAKSSRNETLDDNGNLRKEKIKSPNADLEKQKRRQKRKERREAEIKHNNNSSLDG